MEISFLKDLSDSFNATSCGRLFHSCMVLGKKEILIKITLCIQSHISACPEERVEEKVIGWRLALPRFAEIFPKL